MNNTDTDDTYANMSLLGPLILNMIMVDLGYKKSASVSSRNAYHILFMYLNSIMCLSVRRSVKIFCLSG